MHFSHPPFPYISLPGHFFPQGRHSEETCHTIQKTWPQQSNDSSSIWHVRYTITPFSILSHCISCTQGQQFKALLIGTSEPAWENGESCNPTKSTCDPHVFNTVLTRAQSLVVAIGNPLALIHMESYSLCKERCWAGYIRECLVHDTIITIPQLEEEWHSKGKTLLMQQLHTMP